MMEDMQKMVPLGYTILQSFPMTEEESKMWVNLIAQALPSEMWSKFDWVPIIPGESN